MVWWVAAAGAMGALARYLVHGFVQSRASGLFPLGTVVINVTGSFVLGFLAGLVLYHGLGPDVRTVAGTGFLGAYTTFSSYSYETLGLVEDRVPRAAVLNAVGSVAAGLVAATTGLLLASVC
jgi:CrcB protein